MSQTNQKLEDALKRADDLIKKLGSKKPPRRACAKNR